MDDASAAQSFAALLNKACDGDAVAIGQIWATHQPALVRWLRTSAFDHAEDLAAETWINVMSGLREFTGTEANFRSWLFSIARRRLIDYQRQSISRSSRTGYVNPATAVDPAQTATDGDASRRAVAMIKESLSPDQAEVVLLRVIARLSTNEVAEVLNKPVGTIRVLAHRGLTRLGNVVSPATQEFLEEV